MSQINCANCTHHEAQRNMCLAFIDNIQLNREIVFDAHPSADDSTMICSGFQQTEVKY